MTASAEARVAAYDWRALAGELDSYGCAVLPQLLSSAECSTIAALYSDESHFRSHVYMARHGFGKGEYRYFKYPLPGLLSGLRTALYPYLARVANVGTARWTQQGAFRPTTRLSKRCHLLARLVDAAPAAVRGDYNCLHQDLYGELVFPMQVATLVLRARARFHRRPVRVDRAAAAHAEPRRGRIAAARAMPWPSPFITGRCGARKATIV